MTPTATATPSSPDIEIAVTPDLWRSYRRQRAERQHERPSVAADRALDEARIHKSDVRNRLSRLLEERENERGLRPDPGELREDEALAAAARAAEAEVVHEPDSLEAIEADASQRVVDLKAQIERMAVEALTDGKVASEQKAAESELGEAERALENVARARREISRRETEAGERAAREARENAELAATRMEPAILKRKKALDKHLAAAAAETRALRDEMWTHNAHRAAARVPPFDLKSTAFRPDSVESAVAFHFEGTGCFRGPGRNYPLVRTEVKE